MAYKDDVWAVERFEKLRLLALVIACALLVLSLVTEISWIHWPRALAWVAAGLASFFEGRARKRLGRDPDSCYLRGAMCALVGVICVL